MTDIPPDPPAVRFDPRDVSEKNRGYVLARSGGGSFSWMQLGGIACNNSCILYTYTLYVPVLRRVYRTNLQQQHTMYNNTRSILP